MGNLSIKKLRYALEAAGQGPQAPRVTPFHGLTGTKQRRRQDRVRTGRPHRFSSGQSAGTSRNDYFLVMSSLNDVRQSLSLASSRWIRDRLLRLLEAGALAHVKRLLIEVDEFTPSIGTELSFTCSTMPRGLGLKGGDGRWDAVRRRAGTQDRDCSPSGVRDQ